MENKTCRIRKLGEIIVRLDLEENVDRGKFVKLLETTGQKKIYDWKLILEHDDHWGPYVTDLHNCELHTLCPT